MSAADKLTAIAENVPKVYEAGKQAEHDRFWDAFQENGNKVDYSNTFRYYTWTDENFRPKYDIRPTTATSIFQGNKITDLVKILNECNVVLDFSNCKKLYMAFYYNYSITTVPVVDTRASNDNNDLYYLFGQDTNLKSIEKIILKETGEQLFNGTFANCGSLKEVRFEGVIGQNINLGGSPSLSHDSIVSVINALSETASGKTLTLYKSAVNRAFGININDESTYPEGSEFYTLRHSKDNWTFSYV